MTKFDTKWTLVQHSGFGYARKPGFQSAVEERSLETEAAVERVRTAGGLVFEKYSDASDRADQENYPSNSGIYPHARGTFSRTKVDGLRIYVPASASQSASSAHPDAA
jgi:hypothetical protein